MEKPVFRWLHLSDIHMGHGDAEHGWDQTLVLDALRLDLADQVKRQQAPIHAIFVTGDVAFSGTGKKSTEYSEAKAWLSEIATTAGVPTDRVVIVPGNHDVNRAADNDRSTRRLVDSLRNGSEKIDNVLNDPSDHARLAGRMTAFLDFAADFGGRDRSLHFKRCFEVDGLRVWVIGFNTALLASDETDHGKLRLGKRQLGELLVRPPIPEGDLVIALGHHPLRSGWLADEADMEVTLATRTHAYLAGHVHEAGSEWGGSGGGRSFVRVIAGSAHGEQMPAGAIARHGYNYGAIVRGGEGQDAKMRIWPRFWSPKNGDFRHDVDNTLRDRDYAEHTIGLKLR
jgi:3',5'-cyclic AMP phosphodiesterase CpdA